MPNSESRPVATSIRVDQDHTLEMRADMATKTAEVENVTTGEMYTGGGGDSDCVVTTASISSDENFNRTYSFEVPFAPNQFFIYYRASFTTPTKNRAVCIVGEVNFDECVLTFIGASASGGAFSAAGVEDITVDYDDGVLSIHIPDNANVAFAPELPTSEGWRITGIFTTI